MTGDVPVAPNSKGTSTATGFALGMTAYLIWGLLPLYINMLGAVPPLEILAHRILWSVPVAAMILIALGRTADFIRALKTPKLLAMMLVTALLVSVNWGVYIWSIQINIASQAALGYYINPLMLVVLGGVMLGERLHRLQIAAVILAAIGVLVLALSIGAVPWVAFILATSFTFYGYFRKTVDIGPTQGFLLEVLLLSPVALGWLVWNYMTGEAYFGASATESWLLAGMGVATAVPLILYAYGAKALRLATIGLMQYIAPTMIFLIAVFIFNEPMSINQFIAFIFIWVALALYTWSSFRDGKGQRNG